LQEKQRSRALFIRNCLIKSHHYSPQAATRLVYPEVDLQEALRVAL
jgi:hypothetical protein